MTLKVNVVGKILALKEAKILSPVPLTCEYIMFRGKGRLRMEKELRLLISQPKQEDGSGRQTGEKVWIKFQKYRKIKEWSKANL